MAVKDTTGVQVLKGGTTSSFCVLLTSDGDTHAMIGDMAANEHITVEWVSQFDNMLREAPLVCVDGNAPTATILHVLKTCSESGIPVWYEPTCVSKASRIFSHSGQRLYPSYVSPNLAELRRIFHHITGQPISTDHCADMRKEDKVEEVRYMAQPLLSLIPHLLVSLGQDGMAYISQEEGRGVLYPPAPAELLPVGVVSVTGAGDSLAGTIMSGLVQGFTMDTAIKAGLRAAYLSLLSAHAVSPVLSHAMFSPREVGQWKLNTDQMSL